MPPTSPAPVPLTDHWTIARNHPIFYRAAPGQPGNLPIIHLHGFGISGRYLVPTAARLARWYPTYVPDLPGYGRSPRPEGVLDIPDLATEVVGFMDALGLDRAVLLGNSLGCIVAIEVANLVPDRIPRAILVSPSGGTHNEPLPRGLAQLALDGLHEGPRMTGIAIRDYLKFGLANSVRLFRAMTAYDISAHLDPLQLPLLVVAGTRDPLVSIPQLEETVLRHANMVLAIQDGAAHALNFTHPHALTHTVRAWLEDRPMIPATPVPNGHALLLDGANGADVTAQ